MHSSSRIFSGIAHHEITNTFFEIAAALSPFNATYSKILSTHNKETYGIQNFVFAELKSYLEALSVSGLNLAKTADVVRGPYMLPLEVTGRTTSKGSGRRKLSTIELFLPFDCTRQAGVYLALTRRSNASRIAFRVHDHKLANEVSWVYGFPTPIDLCWPQTNHMAPQKVVVIRENVKYPSGVNIPFQDILDFLKQYKTFGTGCF